MVVFGSGDAATAIMTTLHWHCWSAVISGNKDDAGVGEGVTAAQEAEAVFCWSTQSVDC